MDLLSWNEIRARAIEFAKEWEQAETIRKMRLESKKVATQELAGFPTRLTDLYDPLTPPDLLRDHRDLDRLIERFYGKTFKTDEDRVAFLFERYQEEVRSRIVK